MNYFEYNILDFLDCDSYPRLFQVCSEQLKTKLDSLNITTMRELNKYSFSFYHKSLTSEELAELLFILCNY